MLDPYLIKSLKLLRFPSGNFESVSPHEHFSTILRPQPLNDPPMNIQGKVPTYCKVSFFEGRNRSISLDLGTKFTNEPCFCRRYKFAETFFGLVETSQRIAHFFSELQIALPYPESRRRADERDDKKTSNSTHLVDNVHPIIHQVE